MKRDQKRYKETGYYFAENYSIECPECGKEATVTPSIKDKNAVVLCMACSYKRTYQDFIRHKAFIRFHCPNCGKPIHTEQGNLKEKPKNINIGCPECGLSMKVKPKTEKYSIIKEIQGLKHDPVFGFSLWFQIDIKGNLFWAYNRKHLTEIQIYVESGLRERQWKYGMSMVERLPKFIKEAKNREAILQSIDKLLNK